MKKKVSFGGHIRSMFQMVVLIICIQSNVSGDRAQGCVGSQLSLRCPQLKVIQIATVFLGDSSCYGSPCCITDDDCTHGANENHTMDVHRRCDNKQICTVGVLQERIPCGYKGYWPNNDFERITYNCIDDLQRSTTARLPRPGSTEDNLFTEENPQKKDTENDGTTKSIDEQRTVDSFIHNASVSVSSAILGVGVVGVVCLIITIGIFASVFVVKVRRKRMKHLRSTEAAKTVDGETDGYEAIDVNGAHQGISSEYCELDVVDRARVQRDSHYLQLNKRQQAKSTDEAKKVNSKTDRNEVIDINEVQRSSLETAASVYCELDAVSIEGEARESVQCGSEYLQLYGPLVVYEEPQ